MAPNATARLPPTETSSLTSHDEDGDDDSTSKKRAHLHWSPTRRISGLIVLSAAALFIFLGSTTILRQRFHNSNRNSFRLAFIGNSMFYFNDFPRFLEGFDDDITQDSCLHGGASISSLLAEGNGMFPQFMTPNSIIIPKYKNGDTIYDYGACSVQQLLTGVGLHSAEEYDVFNTTEWIQNPCSSDPKYCAYIMDYYASLPDPPQYDYLIINDNTRNPARNKTRLAALASLKNFFIPYLKKNPHTVPIFLWTHAYSVNSTAEHNMTGLEDVANFTSLTGAGLRQYVAELESAHLKQKARIAPSGLAFLTVHEENYDLWQRLFHGADHLHASPMGTFLQGCVVYYTLKGRMPNRTHVVRPNMAELWSRARMMQHRFEPPNPFPTQEEAEYLYEVAERVMVQGHVPNSYIHYDDTVVAFGG